MYCPECGHDAGDAKFCPECGVDLARVRSTLTAQALGGAGEVGDKEAGDAGRPPAAAPPAKPAGRGFSPAVIWGAFGVIAVIVIVLVVMLSGGFGGNKSPSSSSAGASPTAVMGVTTGSYHNLVVKGNKFYDQGQQLLDAGNFNQGVAYFEAAAMTYAAAWKKQSTDPNVGTAFASALFNSGNLDAAISQANAILAKHPDFQGAYVTKGNALAHKALIAKSQGDTSTAKADNVLAKQAYTKAVALDPTSQAGKLADQGLQSLPK